MSQYYVLRGDKPGRWEIFDDDGLLAYTDRLQSAVNYLLEYAPPVSIIIDPEHDYKHYKIQPGWEE